MIRALPSLLLIAGCASVPAACPEPQITAVICPAHMQDYYDEDFRQELKDELELLPDDSALSKAARAFQAVARKCGSI